MPLTGHALDLLKQLSKKRKPDGILVFPHLSKRQQSPSTEATTKEKPADIRKAWDAALLAAGVEDFRFHDLRHSAASYLAMNGASIPEIADVLGHRTLQMVKRYSHLSEQHTKNIVSKMNGKIFAR